MGLKSTGLYEIKLDLWRTSVIITYGDDIKFLNKALNDQPKELKKETAAIKRG